MDELLLKSPEYAEYERNINSMDLEISMAPFSGYGEQGGILAVIHDVTQQKSLTSCAVVSRTYRMS